MFLRIAALSLCALLAVSAACFAAEGVPEAPLSHLLAHALVLPPPELLRPIVEGGPLKGMTPRVEKGLYTALEAAVLGERILKIAVAVDGTATVAFVKVQAGDAQSRIFSLASVEQDAARTLEVAFSLPTPVRHVDFSAVIPDVDVDGQEVHRSVFSVAAERGRYFQLIRGAPRSQRELLAGLSAVRYDPVYTRHAVDWEAARETMPRTAYSVARLRDIWAGLVNDGATEVGKEDPAAPVSVLLGGVPDSNKVALTIDDGPHPLITPLFLDILRQEGVRATFFVVGEKAEEYPGLVREIARNGHELANHTYSHRRFTTLSPQELWAEVRGCSRIIATLTGQVVRYLRPPGGDYTAASLEVAESLGLTTALWTHNTGDWRRPTPTAIARNATQYLKSGDIILMHQGDMESVRALPLIVEGIRARGLAPCRLGDLTARGTVTRGSVREALAQRFRLHLTE